MNFWGVTVHTLIEIDKHTVEVSTRIGKSKEITVDAYFCIPKEADITPDNYQIEDFYRSKNSQYFYHTAKVKAPLLSQLLRSADPNEELPLFLRAYKHRLKSDLRKLPQINEQVVIFIDETKLLLNTLRVLDVNQGFLKTFRDTDELACFYTEQYLLKFIAKGYNESSSISSAPSYVQTVLAFIEELKEYRIISYGNISKLDTMRKMKKKEKVLYRSIELKRKIKILGTAREQFAFSLSAFLSMFCTTGVVFYFQGGYGSLSLNVFVVLCLSYIFKDRFKELFRNYVLKRISKGKEQHSIDLYDSHNDWVANIKELVEYTELDNKLLKLRSIGSNSKAIEQETVLHYRKRYSTVTDFKKKFTHIRDSIVVDIEPFLRKLPNNELVFTFEKEGKITSEYSRETYDLNLLIVVNQEDYSRYRIKVVNSEVQGFKKVTI